MNYSRRQLEALGEPLGESVTRLKPGGRIYGGGGGGGGSSTQTSVSELPEWARPYAQETLAKASALTAQPQMAEYGGERIAGFSPDQLTAQRQARRMGPAQQLGTATNLASAAGLGALGTEYQAGQFQNQFQAPEQYRPGQFSMLEAQAPQLKQYQMNAPERVTTRSFAQPGAAEGYMSPYMQSVVEKQQRDAMRQAGIAGTQLAGQATQAGAFGGSRFGLMEAERQRNLATQLGDIQATGSQAAFQQAQQQFNAEQQARLAAQQANQQAGLTAGGQNLQALLGVQSLGAQQNLQAQLANQQMLQNAQQAAEQSRQFGAGQGLQAAGLGAQYGQAAEQLGEQSRQYGAGLGMQGLSTALQSAGTLGNLGQTQYGQQMGINQLLNQYGQQQQALRQQGLSQDYQDFLNAQNYPYKQLGFMSDMIRGLPLGQQSTSQMYQAPGSMLGQLGGIGMGLYGMSRAFGMKEGGLTYAEGGVTDDRNVEDILSKLSDAQLAQAKQAALNAQDQNQLQLIEQELAERASMRRGLGSAPINFEAMMPSEQSMARGGIVAFADEGLVQDPMLDMSGGLTPESMEMDRLRVEALKAKRAEEEDRKRMEFLKTAAPEVYNRKMAEKPVAKAEPAPKETVTAQPAPKVVPKAESKASAKSISEAARIVTDVAKTQVPNDDVGKLYEDILAKMKSAPGPEAEALARMLNNAEKRAEDIKARGIGEALMKFGFGMAAGAAKPGVARRSGLAGALEAAAGAAPILGESMAENAKLQQAAEDNALKLRLENARYQSAVESGNKQLAATLAGSISQRNIQQATLQAQIEQNARANALKEKEIAGLAAYRQQAGQSAIQKIADDLQAADPKLDRRSALTEASRISGYSFRSEQSGELQRMALLAKLRAENPMYKVLETQLSMAKTPEQQAAIQQKLTDIEQRSFGKLGLPTSSGVGSGSASQVLRFDSKGNPIQ
jgi:hypothetical protein